MLVDELREIGLDDADARRRRLRDGDAAGDGDGAPHAVGLIAHVDVSPRRAGRRRRADRAPRLRRRAHRAAARRHGARPRRRCRCSPARSATTSSPPAATRCSAPTTRPAWPRSWRRSRTWPRIPSSPRPTLKVGFTPDEEIGEGATLFDVERFGARLRLHARRLRSRARSRTRRSPAPRWSSSSRASTSTRAGPRASSSTPRGWRGGCSPSCPRDRLTPETTARPRGLHPPLRALRRRGARGDPLHRARLRRRAARRAHRPDPADRRAGRRRGAALARLGDRPAAVPQHAPLRRRVPAGRRRRRAGDPRRGDRAVARADPRRHRRLAS